MMMTLPATINDHIIQHSRSKPLSPALYYQDRKNNWLSLSWENYARQVDRIATLLLKQAKSEERFGILLENCLEWDVFEKAGFRTGLIVAGIDPYAPASYQQYILQDAKIAILAVRNLDILKRLDPQSLRHVRLILTVESTQQNDFGGIRIIAYSDILASDVRAAWPDIKSGQDAMIVYTSGTSGNPKGILYTHRQYLEVCSDFIASYGLNDGARFICWLPLANLFQRMINLAATTLGVSIYIVSDPKRLMDEIKYINPTFLIGVPRFYEKMSAGVHAKIAALPAPLRALCTWAITQRVSYQERNVTPPLWFRIACTIPDALILKKIRTGLFGTQIQFLITGSAPMDIPTMKFYYALGVPLYEAYGQSENITPIAMNRPGDYRLGSVGKPFPGNTVVIGTDDEIWVQGHGVFKAYLDGSKEDKFTADGFLATGDKGHFDADGFLYLTGRKSDIIKISTGRKIIPGKIEKLLTQTCHDFDQIIVTGHGKKHLLALASLRTPLHESEDEWKKAIAAINDTLADYEKIYGVLLIPALTIESGQLTPNLKLRRKKIEEMYSDAIDALYRQMEKPVSDIIIMKASPTA